MPTSLTGPSAGRPSWVLDRSRDAGFTLIEILVVVTIIGIFVGVAALSTDLVSFDRKMQREARRLETLLQLASETALLQSLDYGLQIYSGGYDFFIFDHNTQAWRPMGGDPVFAAQRLERMVLELKVEDREIELDLAGTEPLQAAGDAADDADEPDEPLYPTPQVVIYSSGEITPFELRFLDESEPFEPGILLSVEFNGKAEIGRDGDDL
jgi:general secretion pathway protein H